jgi:DNA-binding response OmpR family regulator
MKPSTPVVLIVDDDALIRRALSGVLTGHGFATAEATSVAGAIAVAEQQNIAAVVLDLTLDRSESGLDYLAWLRQQPTHERTPILILTGRPTLEAGDQDLINQYRAYVFYKPVSMMVLADFLTRLASPAR